MNLASTIYVLRWLINDTFRQALAGKVLWIMLGVSLLAIIFCLGISVEGGTFVEDGKIIDAKTNQELSGPPAEPGQMRLLYGMMTIEIHRGINDEVRLIHMILAIWVAGAIGLLLTLMWTAGFVPDFLQPSSAVVLLAKPAPRWLFLFGKYIGVVLFVAVMGMIFFLGTWAALGVRTGVWNNIYLVGWPMLVLQFAVFFSVSILIAVTWRSTMACILGILLFWVISFGVNYGRYTTRALPTLAGQQARPLSPLVRGFVETGYWIFPKPADYIMMLEDLLLAANDKVTLSSLPEFKQSHEDGSFQPFAALAASVVFALVMLALAGRQHNDVDY
jgi:ABC-type transport system involved in multi-copper enzyme maturation permease subunit